MYASKHLVLLVLRIINAAFLDLVPNTDTRCSGCYTHALLYAVQCVLMRLYIYTLQHAHAHSHSLTLSAASMCMLACVLLSGQHSAHRRLAAESFTSSTRHGIQLSNADRCGP
jgi:hypothetical protein